MVTGTNSSVKVADEEHGEIWDVSSDVDLE